MLTAKSMVSSASESVGSRRWMMRTLTGVVREDRDAEVALDHAEGPAPELHQQRIVEPEPLADGDDLLRRRVIAGDDRGRIARRKMQEQEDEDADERHHQEGRCEAMGEIAEHPSVGLLNPGQVGNTPYSHDPG